jgi:hypothetical protein
MSPLQIHMLLHFFASPSAYTGPGANSRAYDAGVKFLLDADLIFADTDKGIYRATDRGHAHVMQLCHLPYPQHGWFGVDGTRIQLLGQP